MRKENIGSVVVGFALAAMVTGCAPRVVNLSSSFDVGQAGRMTQKGVNIITGSALIRQQGGGVVTCAGLPVSLIPSTAYADERIRVLYGNNLRGYSSVNQAVRFQPDPSTFYQLTKDTVCDAQGNFQFLNVADGTFYVVSRITWMVGYSAQGGSIMHQVTVQGGDAKQVVLSP